MTRIIRTGLRSASLVLVASLVIAPASAQDKQPDKLKMVIGQINNWENQPPTLGQDAGIFKKHSLEIEATGTAGAGETLQPVIAGSADLGGGVGVAGAMRAFSKGAPVRILLPAFTGTGDLYWYVKADSPIKSLKDATASNTIAYSTSGSSSNNIVVAFVKELGAKAKPTATGSPAGTLTQVMSGQIDIGWAAPPFGLKEIKEGQIRIIARGSDVPSLKGQTVRAIIVNADSLKAKRDAIMRFAAAYREAADWMYSDPKAIEMYGTKINADVGMLKEAIPQFQPKEALQSDAMADLDGAIRDAVALKFLDAPLTKEQIAEFIQIPKR
jgi:NitT/TauT family transport system substrate-binding protein